MIIQIDTSTWTRMLEVEEFAASSNISVADAIRTLVNTGLSHR